MKTETKTEMERNTIPAITTAVATTTLPPFAYYWNPGIDTYSITLMVDVRYVTSQLARMNREGGSFEPFTGAQFQRDCKAKMMQLLYGDVVRTNEEIPDVLKIASEKSRR